MPLQTLTVKWFGHSAFLFHSPGGKNVLIDPWLDNPRAPADAKNIAAVDLILITHGHDDHVGNTVEIAQRTKARVFSIFELSLYLKSQGIELAEGMNKGGTLRFDGISVTMVDAKHSSDINVDGTVLPGGEAAGYVITFENGFKVYHAGDTALFGDMEFIRKLYAPDAVFLPIGNVFTMGPREAAMACELLKPKHIVGMHYGTFPILSGTPAELKKYLPEMDDRVIELEIGVERSLP